MNKRIISIYFKQNDNNIGKNMYLDAILDAICNILTYDVISNDVLRLYNHYKDTYTGLEISSCPLARHGSNSVGAT